MKTFSHIISWVFLPLLTPVYGLLLALYVPSMPEVLYFRESLYFMSPEAKQALLLMFVTFSALAPGISFLILHKQKVITTIDMEDKTERSIPMFLMLAYCLLLFGIFFYKFPEGQLPKYVYALPLAGVFVTVSYTLINNWIKISLHGGGAGILTGFLLAYSIDQLIFPFWVIIVAVIASGLTLSARLYLHKHTPREVYTGWSLAVLITFMITHFYPM